MRSCRGDIKTFDSFQHDPRAYGGNLIYGVRLQMDVGDRVVETFFCCVDALFRKALKDIDFVSDGHC